MLNDQTNIEFQAAACDLKREIYQLGITLSLPHVLMRPKISIDGNQWCALYGENLQDGVAGFGSSPCEAMGDFDRAWNTRLKPNAQVHGKNSRSEAKAGFSRATPCWAMLVEHHTEQGIEWVVSFEGSNPPPEKAVHCANRDEAEKLVKLMNERPILPLQISDTPTKYRYENQPTEM